MFLKLIIVSVLLCVARCQNYEPNSIFSYQLPDGEGKKSLNVTINSESYQQFEISIECYNYDSLKYLEVRLGKAERFELRNGILLEFIKCFNNETDNENYNYDLSLWFNSLPYFNTDYSKGYPIKIKLDEYAEVNSDVLFKYFDFGKFSTVNFINLGFKSTKFLRNLYCRRCIFENNGRIDFNDFSDNIADTDQIQISFNKLINLNRENLGKFKRLTSFEISNFVLDDSNAFNVPQLFENNVNITGILIEQSKDMVVLHDRLIRGLKKLERVKLEGLQLDNVQSDFFKDLGQLRRVILSNNNIKTVDPAIFQTNENLTYISFADNPFYTESHDEIEAFNLTSQYIRLNLGNFTKHSFDLLKQLAKNSNVSAVTYQSFLMDKFNIADFGKIITLQRDSYLDLSFSDGEPILDLEVAKSFGNKIQSIYDYLYSDGTLNIVVATQFADDAVCHDCTMIKRLYPQFLKNYRNRAGYYFEDNGIFIELKIPESCRKFDILFEEAYDENCPVNCACKYSPLLDKVKIDCSNKNLTTIPRLPYPVQFEQLHSIDLYLQNNSVTELSLANQDSNVLEKLSTLNLKNNQIKTISNNGQNLTSLRVLTICGNPVIPTNDDHITLSLASGTSYFNKYSCKAGGKYPQVGKYIKENKSNEVEYLTNCN